MYRSLAIVIAAALLSVPAQAADAVRLALLPIAVHASTAEDTAYLSEGLSQMISARLEQFDGLRVVRPGAGPGAELDDAAAVEAARGAGAAFVLYGSFTQFGDGASLDLRCAEVAEARADDDDDEVAIASRRVFVHSGTLAEIIPKLDIVAEKVARYAFAGEGGPHRSADIAKPVAPPSGSGPDVSAEVQELLKRVDALERTVYKPLAQESPPAEAGDAGSEGTAVR